MRASSKSMLTAGSGCTMATLLTLCCLCDIKSFATQMYLIKYVRNKTVILGTFPHKHQASRWSYECMFPCSSPAYCSKVGRKKIWDLDFWPISGWGPLTQGTLIGVCNHHDASTRPLQGMVSTAPQTTNRLSVLGDQGETHFWSNTLVLYSRTSI